MNSSNGNQSDSREDDFGEMLRSAGRGPRLSDEARARIRESVEATWQDAVGRGSHSRSPDAGKPRRGTVSIGSQARRWGRRTRWVVSAVTAAAAALVAVLVLDSPENTAPSVAIAFAQVTATDGLVNVTRGNRERIVDAGEAFEMLVGDRISTSETGRLALRLSAESELRLNTETIVEITRTQAVRLVSGMVYFDAQPQAQGTDFSVHTDFGVVSHLGTQYAAGIDSQGLHVRVREGEAAVSDSGLFDDSVAMRVAPGEQLQIDTMGRVSRSPYSVDHPGWTWAQELARVPDDGPLSVADLLDWDARATGRAVQFDSEAARNLAEGVMLNQVGGLSPADVLGVINSTTNLEVSESGTTLNVASR